MNIITRRSFLTRSFAAVTVFGSGAFASTQTAPAPAPAGDAKPAAGTEPNRKPPLASALVFDFVRAGHANLPKVKQMLADEPMLINAMWDWGAGDWETALGGASHTGHREVALHLLDRGARIDAFCAAMLGEVDLVTAIVRFNPASANARGPHGYMLMYHAGHSGKVALAEAIRPHLTNCARDFNQALLSATGAGHADLVAYLLDHGVDNPNGKNILGETPLDRAIKDGNEKIAKLLRAHGGVTSG